MSDHMQYTEKLNEKVNEHSDQFKQEEKENEELDEQQMESKGYQKKYGLIFDKDGNVIPMSKKDVVMKLLDTNIRIGNFSD